MAASTKPATASKAAPVKKAAPAKKAAPVKAAPVKATPPAKKAAAPAKKAAAPAKKAAPVKAAPAKKTAPVTAVATPVVPVQEVPAPAPTRPASKKKAAPVKPAPPARPVISSKAVVPGTRPAPRLAVREDESPWTKKELAEVRAELDAEVERLHHQIHDAEEGIADLLRDSGDGAGDDQADAGTKTFEREHEMSLANNARELLQQNERALQRLDDGTYGACERCGKPVGKLRLQAFPRATLCVSCKQLEDERR